MAKQTDDDAARLEMEERIASERDHLRRTGDAVADARIEVARAERLLASLEQRRSELQASLEDARARTRRAERGLKDIGKGVEARRTALEGLDATMDHERRRHGDVERELAAVRRRHLDTLAELDRARRGIKLVRRFTNP
jgi:chromosome segregation ATPase